MRGRLRVRYGAVPYGTGKQRLPLLADSPSPSTGEGWGEGDERRWMVRLAAAQTPHPRPLSHKGRGEMRGTLRVRYGAVPYGTGKQRLPLLADSPSPSTGEGWGEGDERRWMVRLAAAQTPHPRPLSRKGRGEMRGTLRVRYGAVPYGTGKQRLPVPRILPLPRRERVGVRVMRDVGWCVSRQRKPLTPGPSPARGEGR
jgi:hypothetical protein